MALTTHMDACHHGSATAVQTTASNTVMHARQHTAATWLMYDLILDAKVAYQEYVPSLPGTTVLSSTSIYEQHMQKALPNLLQ